MSASDRELDVVVWGATGFTGRLVAAYLWGRYGEGDALRFGLGGRNAEKLAAVRKGLGPAAADLPLVVGDSDDEGFLERLAQRTRVVCTTVGPYALYGSKLLAACASAGTHYCDLTGEVQWMRRMIDQHQKQAEATGARIVHNCGFDSIPSDLGVHVMQREMRARHGTPSPHVQYRVASFSGGFSGGTAASLLQVLEESVRDPAVRRVMADPYGLNPEGTRHGPDGPDQSGPVWDPDFEAWTGPFVMAGINHKVVRRTNALLGYPYGQDFRYDEAMLMGRGPVGWLKAAGLSAGLGATLLAGLVGPLRRGMQRLLPAPGEGPDEATRRAGHFEILLRAEHPSDPALSLRGRVRGEGDPGYLSTSRMLGESAVCLARDVLAVGGGLWTPAAAMGDALVTRLEQNASVRFEVD